MGRPRRRHETTAEQQADVIRRLDVGGESYRAIALAAFGDVGAKNRVARIAARRRAEAALEEQLRAELDRERALIDESLTVEERRAELERIGGNVERVRRLNELTREP
jgi:hypothetical protein